MSLEIPKHIKVHEALGVKSQAQNDNRYVKKSGDTMTGDLNFPVTGYLMTDSNGVKWRVTVGTSGNLTTTLYVVDTIGTPMGLLLSLTYAS